MSFSPFGAVVLVWCSAARPRLGSGRLAMKKPPGLSAQEAVGERDVAFAVR
jgi:hypothetical protein